MLRTIFGEYSKDGYGYWGYVEQFKKMILFTSREEYLEYISELSDVCIRHPERSKKQ